MKLIVLTSRFPYPLEKGDKLRLFNHLRQLSGHFEIYLIALAESEPSVHDLECVRQYCSEIFIHKLGIIRRLRNLMLLVFKGYPFHVSYFYDRKIHSEITRRIREINPDHVYCHLIRMAPYAIELDFPKTLDLMDSFTLNMQSRRGCMSIPGRIERQLTRKYEEDIGVYFDHYTVISERDASQFSFKDRILVVRNGVDLHQYVPNTGIEKRFDLAFCGNLGYTHNQRAVDLLLNQILVKLPDVTTVIAGARTSRALLNKQSSKVRIVGWVDDLRTVYWSSKIFVAPIFTGSGLQNKVLEAMALGIPCIITPFINESVGAEDNKEALVAVSPGDFILKIRKLLQDEKLRMEIAANGRIFVENEYNWEKNSVPLINAIKHHLTNGK